MSAEKVDRWDSGFAPCLSFSPGELCLDTSIGTPPVQPALRSGEALQEPDYAERVSVTRVAIPQSVVTPMTAGVLASVSRRGSKSTVSSAVDAALSRQSSMPSLMTPDVHKELFGKKDTVLAAASCFFAFLNLNHTHWFRFFSSFLNFGHSATTLHRK